MLQRQKYCTFFHMHSCYTTYLLSKKPYLMEWNVLTGSQTWSAYEVGTESTSSARFIPLLQLVPFSFGRYWKLHVLSHHPRVEMVTKIADMEWAGLAFPRVFDWGFVMLLAAFAPVTPRESASPCFCQDWLWLGRSMISAREFMAFLEILVPSITYAVGKELQDVMMRKIGY